MNKDIIQISKQVLEATNGGLDIIQSIYPQANPKKKFKLREERTESCTLHKMPDNNWILKDFGSNESGKNGVQLYARENSLQFAEATLILARQYGIDVGDNTEKNEAKFRNIDQSQWDKEAVFDENNFAYETKDFTAVELKTLGPFVKPEHCHKYGLFSLKWYAVKKEGKITIVEPTNTFPIFIFCFEEAGNKFYKIYQPKSEDKKWRFFWKGKKPEGFLGGLDVLKKEMAKRKAEEAESLADEGALEVKTAKKIDKGMLCSGERDAINMASLGYFVLWQNSETAELKPAQYKSIMNNVDELYNIPDLDDTGKRAGHELAMKYLDIKTIWLPNWLRKRKDWRGNARKDLCDYFELHKYESKMELDKKMKTLTHNAYPLRFWDETTNKDGQLRYNFNNVHAFNFLFRNGFSRLNVEEEKEGYKFIYTNEHVVKEIKSIEVKDYINSFLERRNIATAIRNMVYNTTRLSEGQIANLPRLELDFTDYSKTMQMFFFSNQSWEITAHKIVSHTQNITQKFVWNNDIIDHRIKKTYSQKINPKAIKLEHDYFKIKKTDFHYDIEILEKNCEYLNFLIQISRMHWSAELVDDWDNEEEQANYHKNNLFNIAGDRLDEDQKAEQKAHLVNKIFMLGYLMHRYKHPNRAWAVYAMENSVLDDNESHGGSGKSVLLKTPGILMNWKIIDARNTRMWENNFLFDGVSEHTDYILFDDADKNFRLANLYSSITGPLTVNPKHSKPFTIPFRDSPKYAISSNYSLRETDPSTTRRLLFTALSDYYHEAGEFYDTKRDPTDDFGHALFSDWNDEQWNKLFNFLAQCTRFYLSVNEKINPPMEKVMLRNLQSEMGVSFMEWADDYLSNMLNVEFNKKQAHEHLKTTQNSLKNISSNNFIKRIKAWCKFNGHHFMPKDKTDANGRIQKQNEEGKREDFLFISSEEISEDEIENKLPF